MLVCENMYSSTVYGQGQQEVDTWTGGRPKGEEGRIGRHYSRLEPTYQNSRRARENATSGTALDRCAQADRLQGYADLEKATRPETGGPCKDDGDAGMRDDGGDKG